ncbi:hypothetical protein EV191_10282 [Tamaricihabitans halophyticus]|uniref:Uncharacterized protein n=1 Tax=Tamaricihabitans halophyticus TaxID=1262583 RepID=A0A4R2QXJ6_9PSEU|nr:hypothetical protein [Tamaricihabitans halophyticus]TCP54873.1 hypothetical protein EV191_10282 [Tamaricihabitans halophyticus]
MLTWLRDWWDGIELWLTQLWYPFQLALVLVVLLPLCLVAAWLIDRAVDVLGGWLGKLRGNRAEQPESADADAERGRVFGGERGGHERES